LKQLPANLKYAFLGKDITLPIIISADLTKLEEEKMLRVVREHKKVIAWSIYDIKGISLSFCMLKILMEDNYKTSVQL